MPTTVYITDTFDHMSKVAADLVEADIREKLADKPEYVLGLATGNSPTGLYKHLAKAFNAKRIDAKRVRSFNLDEYVGLPGENPQQRALHCESYCYFMMTELFGLLREKFIETNVPWGTLIEQSELAKAIEQNQSAYQLQGTENGKVVRINDGASGVLKMIKQQVLDGYAKKIASVGGIDLHIIGVGGRGHVAFHESGIPFAGNPMLLVKLDDNTVRNAVEDGHFASVDDSPRYAISMGAELVYRARKIVLVANGSRKTGPIAESLLGPVTPDVPISYGQKYAAEGGNLAYVLDTLAAADLLAKPEQVKAKGITVVDLRGKPYPKVDELTFTRCPQAGRIG